MVCLQPFYKRILQSHVLQVIGREIKSEQTQFIEIPCGKCVLCLSKRVQEWSLRMKHELFIKKFGFFITLTYRQDTVPLVNIERDDYLSLCEKYKYDYFYRKELNQYTTVQKSDLQKFFKRLRYYINKYDRSIKVKYFACGEYGDKTDRAHYHAIILGLNPYDINHKLLIRKSWTLGDIHFGDASYGSARYVAKYCNKIHLSSNYKQKYIKQGRNIDFKLSSQGLGKDYVLLEKDNIYENLCLYDNQYKKPIPRTYYRWLCRLFDDFSDRIKEYSQKLKLDRFYRLLEHYSSKLDIQYIFNRVKDIVKLNVVRKNHFLIELDVYSLDNYPILYNLYYNSLVEKAKLKKELEIMKIREKKFAIF